MTLTLRESCADTPIIRSKLLVLALVLSAAGALYGVASASPDVSPAGAIAFYASMIAASVAGIRGRVTDVVLATTILASLIIGVAGASPGHRDGWDSLWWMSVIILAVALGLLAVLSSFVATVARRLRKTRR